MRIVRAGLCGALCVLGDTPSDPVADRVAGLARAVEALEHPGIIETVPGYASLLVRFDPLRVRYGWLCRRLRALERGLASGASEKRRVVELPVCYGGEYGPDLAFVAEHAGLSPEEVVQRHSGVAYRIHMLGFLPGFPYLGGLDPRLRTPRLSSPRARIPAGSVGIGDRQTGVYPIESPGGWQLIGRTPLRLFAPDRPPLYRAGDAIRFVPVSQAEYQEMERREWASR